jgi:ribose transport system permease protein
MRVEARTASAPVDDPEPSGPVAPPRAPRFSGVTAALGVIQLGPVLILGVMWVVMALASPFFLTSLNMSNLLQAVAVTAILAVGQFVVILTGEIDLSAGAVLVLSTVVGGKLAQAGASGLTVMVVMLGTGVAAGVINGLLIEWLRLGSSFIVTLGTLSIATGLGYVISQGVTFTGFPALITTLGGQKVGDVPYSAFVVLAFALLAIAITARMQWGRWIYALGGNREAAVRVGIPVRRVSTSVFVLSGLSAGLAGVISAGFTDSGSPAVGFTAQLDAISAVIIGGAALFGGRGSIVGTLVGALILGTVHNGINLLSVDPNWEPMVLGSVLILAIGIDKVRSRLELRLRLIEARRHGDIAPAAPDPSSGGAGGAT